MKNLWTAVCSAWLLTLGVCGAGASEPPLIEPTPVESTPPVEPPPVEHDGHGPATPPSDLSLPPSDGYPTPAPASHGYHGPRHRFNAGASLYFLKPHFTNNPAFITTTVDAATGVIIAPGQTTTDFSWDCKPAAAFWLGVTGESGLGWRTKYFHFDQSSNTLDAVNNTLTLTPTMTTFIRPPGSLLFINPSSGTPVTTPNFGSPGVLGILTPLFGNPDVLTFGSDLQVQVVDLEATYDVQRGPWLLQISGGARYLHMEQNYTGRLSNTLDLGALGVLSETQLLTFGQKFDGGGPTASVQASYRLGQNLSVFGNVRGSLLFGRSTENQNFTQTVIDPIGLVGGAVVNVSATRSRDILRPVAEVELGLEYGLDWGRMRPFVRGAVLNQTYFDAGSASQTDGNLSLFGAQVTLGFSF